MKLLSIYPAESRTGTGTKFAQSNCVILLIAYYSKSITAGRVSIVESVGDEPGISKEVFNASCEMILAVDCPRKLG